MQVDRSTRTTSPVAGEPSEKPIVAKVVEIRKRNQDHDSLSENFNKEIDAWARMATARNGFGDLPGVTDYPQSLVNKSNRRISS